MVAPFPNESQVVATILATRADENGWGAWGDLLIESTNDVPGRANWARHLVGKTIQVFIPPPLVASIIVGRRYSGSLTVGSSPARAEERYSLVPGSERS